MMFKPMLAARLEGAIRFPVLVSPKLDGIRAMVVGGVVYSRKLKPIPCPTVQRLFGKPEYEGYDGELIYGLPTAKNAFNTTQSYVMSGTEGSKPELLTFFVFDRFGPEAFTDRLAAVTAGPQVVPLGHTLVNSQEELDALESGYLADGFEGVMVRSITGAYKQGRSTMKEGGLIKVKRFEDSDAEVIGVIELEHNDNVAMVNELGKTKRSSAKAGMRKGGTMGALVVRDRYTGVEFQIGTGFTMEQRAQWWSNREQVPGLFVKYRFLAVGMKDKPRHPSFIGVRDPRDMD